MSTILSNGNEKGYIKKKSLSLSPRMCCSQSLLSHETGKKCDRNYSSYEGEVELTPSLCQELKEEAVMMKSKGKVQNNAAIPTLP